MTPSTAHVLMFVSLTNKLPAVAVRATKMPLPFSGRVVALAVDVAVLDVECFTGDPANAVQARAGAVDGKVSNIDHVISAGVNDDAG